MGIAVWQLMLNPLNRFKRRSDMTTDPGVATLIKSTAFPSDSRVRACQQ